MKLSIFALAASVAVVSAHKYHHPPPSDEYPSPPVYTPTHGYNTTTVTPTSTKTLYPPPGTTTISDVECPPIKTVTTWVNYPPKPTYSKPDEGSEAEPTEGGEGGEDEPEETGEGGEGGEDQPPATQSGPETVPTAAAVNNGAPSALLAAGLIAAALF